MNEEKLNENEVDLDYDKDNDYESAVGDKANEVSAGENKINVDREVVPVNSIDEAPVEFIDKDPQASENEVIRKH